MTTTPTPEDYQIGPEEALEINAKATQGEWQAHTQGVYDGTVISVTEDCIHHICIDPQYDDRPADRAAIAYNHNNTPGLARRLIAEREEKKRLEDAILDWHTCSAEQHSKSFDRLEAQAIRIQKERADAEIIRKERENAKAN